MSDLFIGANPLDSFADLSADPDVLIDRSQILPWQNKFLNTDKQTRILRCGRRSGKTYIFALDMLRLADQGAKVIWYVAPSYNQTNAIWRYLRSHALQPYVRSYSRTKPYSLLTLSGCEIHFMTAGSDERLRGEECDALYLDECAFLDPEVIELLQPFLLNSYFPGGRMVMSSTPNGYNHFYELHRPLKEGGLLGDPEAAFFHQTTYDNFLLRGGRAGIDAQRRKMPRHKFLQEVMAEFVTTGDAAITDLRPCLVPDYPDVRPVRWCGIDLAVHQDFTVLLYLDDRLQVRHLSRFQALDWPKTTAKVRHQLCLCRPWLWASCVDETGIGRYAYDELKNTLPDGFPLIPFNFTAKSKTQLLERLIAALQDAPGSTEGTASSVKIRDCPEFMPLIQELSDLVPVRRADGTFTYEAPPGLHDDCVMALALALEAARSFHLRHTANQADVSRDLAAVLP